MKVVLFCGGLGMRLREYSTVIPKPMVNIGDRPILWHLMKYYTHYGHCDFVVCLGHQADVIREFFWGYSDCVTRREEVSPVAERIELSENDIGAESITLADTGMDACIGERLKAVEPLVRDEPVFLANYSDNVTDLDLSKFIAHFHEHEAIASFVSVRPTQTFHSVHTEDGSVVTDIVDVRQGGMWINGGYFILRNRIFDYIEDGDELVVEPFRRLIGEKKLITYPHDSFWACMDTFKEQQHLDEMYRQGPAAWEVWRTKESM